MSFADKATIVWYVKANSTSTYIQCIIGKLQRYIAYLCVIHAYILKPNNPGNALNATAATVKNTWLVVHRTRSDYRFTVN